MTAEASPALRHQTILVVDDDPILCGILAESIGSAGFGVECASTVAGCLEKLNSTDMADAPAALLVDIFMPRVDGFDLMRALAARKCRSPLIVMTGVDADRLAVAGEFGRAWGLTILATMEKPLQRERLHAHLRALRAGRPAIARRAPVILVVEDDEDVRDIVAQIFRNAGFGVIEAPGGRQALDQLRADDSIDILFTDIDMAPMNGIDLALAAERLRPKLRIVFTSGKTRQTPIAHSLFVGKPYRPAELVKFINEALVN